MGPRVGVACPGVENNCRGANARSQLGRRWQVSGRCWRGRVPGSRLCSLGHNVSFGVSQINVEALLLGNFQNVDQKVFDFAEFLKHGFGVLDRCGKILGCVAHVVVALVGGVIFEVILLVLFVVLFVVFHLINFTVEIEGLDVLRSVRQDFFRIEENFLLFVRLGPIGESLLAIFQSDIEHLHGMEAVLLGMSDVLRRVGQIAGCVPIGLDGARQTLLDFF